MDELNDQFWRNYANSDPASSSDSPHKFPQQNIHLPWHLQKVTCAMTLEKSSKENLYFVEIQTVCIVKRVFLWEQKLLSQLGKRSLPETRK